MRNNFEERKSKRIQFAHQQAEKNKSLAVALHNRASEMASVIPLGQPILIGHHSERKHRNALDKIHNTHGKAFAAEDKANYYESKAESIQNSNLIFSDDPQALQKLKKELQSLQEKHQFMKDANKCIKAKDKEAFLLLPNATPSIWEELTKPKFSNIIGFASFSLQNSNANITRVKRRIEEMEKLATATTSETIINGVRLVTNVEANRLQLFFPGTRVSRAVYVALRKLGFVACRSQGSFQRQLKSYAVPIAKDFLEKHYLNICNL